ncbi:MAG: hypothetical protein LBO71_00205 [Prevotellaceae bacterium]|nr:hypothetical protein [Prevotellaceae bacterium]
MDNAHYLDSYHRQPSREQYQPSDDELLPELTEELEHLLSELQELEVDVDQQTLQRVLEYARKA